MNLARTTMELTVASTAVALAVPAAAGAAPAETVASGGFGWLDLGVGVAVLAGILLLGLYGDRVVGAIIVGLVEIPVAAAKVVGRVARRTTRLHRRQPTTEAVARRPIERLG